MPCHDSWERERAFSLLCLNLIQIQANKLHHLSLSLSLSLSATLRKAQLSISSPFFTHYLLPSFYLISHDSYITKSSQNHHQKRKDVLKMHSKFSFSRFFRNPVWLACRRHWFPVGGFHLNESRTRWGRHPLTPPRNSRTRMQAGMPGAPSL